MNEENVKNVSKQQSEWKTMKEQEKVNFKEIVENQIAEE